eukprot:gnl/MRDRNA2_/MRDRNA2_92284_c0_seq1.p1 gnl/MRDRNA2_/MRDRNA2_92284_c0~~gnl/MRDRNA2_/MRDRNA2_92284_c0_seq1.p1  ORF type:complete len:500 (-),score=73.32 gnl/MRDRNA2_/MRDRNA2_92284_c0_seq1:122-1621(-)
MNRMGRSAMPVTQKSRWHPQTLDLTGARVLITGATSGIGKACAFRFQELGCNLILVGQNEEALQALGVELSQELDRPNPPEEEKLHEFIRLDVRNVDLIHQLANHVGHIDILINNAGTNLGGETVDSLKTDDMERMVAVNYLAPMAFVSAFAPMMKQRGSGHIINICSTAANDVYPNSSVYCSTKAALAAYTVAARHDLVDTPIRVSSISPGLVDTPLHEKKLGGYDQSRKVFDGVVPLFPEDIADQIIYVSTRARHVQVADISSYATNQSHSSVKGIPGVARMGPALGGRLESMQQEFNSDRYDTPSNKSYMSRNDMPPYMQNNGAMRQGSHADRDRYVPSWGGGSQGMSRNGPPTPTSGFRDPPTPTNSRPNTSYFERGQDGWKAATVTDLMNNNNDGSQNGHNGGMFAGVPGQMPGQMPPDLPGQFPGEMPYDRNELDNQRNSYRQSTPTNHERGKGHQSYEPNQFGSSYRNPAEIDYYRDRNQQPGSSFDSRRAF